MIKTTKRFLGIMSAFFVFAMMAFPVCERWRKTPITILQQPTLEMWYLEEQREYPYLTITHRGVTSLSILLGMSNPCGFDIERQTGLGPYQNR
jgi:hypothetical protein